MQLKILYHDSNCIAIVKPAGLLVHRSALAFGETEFAVQILSRQIGQRVYPVHRLDRPTSGVLLFALNSEFARTLSEEFALQRVEKTYHAIVRGIPPAEIVVDYPLKEELDPIADVDADLNKGPQEAVTFVKTLASIEFPVSVDRYPTSRYSLVSAKPRTGRKHQIRRHLRHLGHPIIGDVNHGVGKHNRYFANEHGTRRLLLACTQLSFYHSVLNQKVELNAPLCADFAELVRKFGWDGFNPAE